MIKINNYEFEIEDIFYTPEFNSFCLYFIGPKEMIIDSYPDAESTELSIDFVNDNTHSESVEVMISPTKDGSDYDWNYFKLDAEEIDKLITYGLESIEKDRGTLVHELQN